MVKEITLPSFILTFRQFAGSTSIIFHREESTTILARMPLLLLLLLTVSNSYVAWIENNKIRVNTNLFIIILQDGLSKILHGCKDREFWNDLQNNGILLQFITLLLFMNIVQTSHMLFWEELKTVIQKQSIYVRYNLGGTLVCGSSIW